MGGSAVDTRPMTVEDFYVFTDARPDNEKWELFDGEPFLNASPASHHQVIIKNLIINLGMRERELRPAWVVIPGIGARVSPISRPEPDVMILPRQGESLDPGYRDTTEAMVLIEVMSPSTSRRDLKWKREAYTSMAALTHYIVVAQDKVEVVVFSRDRGFAEHRLRSPDDIVDLSALGVRLPLSEIYRDTGLL